MLPSPPHRSQTVERTSCPNAVRVTARSWPDPPQRGHVSIGVPGSAPLPWQRGQVSTASYSTSFVIPVAASWSVTSTLTATSPPCIAPPRPPPNSGSPPKKASKMSANEPKPWKLDEKPLDWSPSWPYRSYSERRSASVRTS